MSPLAYFITFSCYGQRLHGDARGTVDRHDNVPRTRLLPANAARQRFEESLLQQPPASLNNARRSASLAAIDAVCRHRGWTLHAVNVRTTHVHLVLTANGRPEPIMNSLKSWLTRNLRAANLVDRDKRLWSRHGSTRYLWSENEVRQACIYVTEAQ